MRFATAQSAAGESRTLSARNVRRTLFVALVLGACTPIPMPSWAQAPPPRAPAAAPAPDGAARDAALRALADRLDLPLVEESIAIFSTQLRRTLPPYFVDLIGTNATLGPRWKRGNPWYDQTLHQVDAALADEEARGGPLLRLEHRDLLYAVNVPWTLDDISFVDGTLDTDLGREAQRAIDAKAALQVTHTLRRRIAIGPGGAGLADAFADLDARANAQFGDAALMLLPMRATDPLRTERLQRLLESVTTAPSDAIGARVVDRLSRRLVDAAAAQLPTLLGNIVEFRSGQ